MTTPAPTPAPIPPQNPTFNWIFQILTIAAYVAQAVGQIIHETNDHEAATAADVKQRASEQLEVAVSQGRLHPAMLNGADALIDAAIEAHPDIPLPPVKLATAE